MSSIYPCIGLTIPGLMVKIIYRHLDGFLICPEWNNSFRAMSQIGLPKVISDHRPILLESRDWDATPSYFTFENMWL